MWLRTQKGVASAGKTMLAKAVAHHTTAAFIRVVGSEFVQKYLGEVRAAAWCMPCCDGPQRGAEHRRRLHACVGHSGQAPGIERSQLDRFLAVCAVG